MAQNKKEKFSGIESEVADFAKVLSHPARIAILKKLADENKCICGEIVDVLPLAQSTVSQHLKELQQSGIIQGTIDGLTSCYCINWIALDKEVENFNKLFEQLKKKKINNCC
jgi:ArsR family transcriptional regulator